MRIVFHPLFLFVVAASIWYGLGLYMMMCVLAVLIHEFSHAVTARCFGVKASRITLLPFGGAVSIDCAFLKRSCQATILMAGAFGNMCACVVAGALLWLVPQFFNSLGLFIFANITVAVLNLLPFYPLDGGKAIELFANKAMTKVLYVISNLTFTALFFVACFALHSWSIGFFALIMLASVNTQSESTYVVTLREVLKKGRYRNG
ncbi:MAG: hypothetical protein LBG88_00820 [Christensenellaceae bacterium]|nr:hypothetical protein [Christensenellaceae bacterium]